MVLPMDSEEEPLTKLWIYVQYGWCSWTIHAIEVLQYTLNGSSHGSEVDFLRLLTEARAHVASAAFIPSHISWLIYLIRYSVPDILLNCSACSLKHTF